MKNGIKIILFTAMLFYVVAFVAKGCTRDAEDIPGQDHLSNTD
jgi:hypothetical protein